MSAVFMEHPMTYAELRHLELSLQRYKIHYGTDANDDTLRAIIKLVGTRATKEQRNSPRVCAWCLRDHTDSHPDFCNECASKPRSMMVEEARRNS